PGSRGDGGRDPARAGRTSGRARPGPPGRRAGRAPRPRSPRSRSWPLDQHYGQAALGITAGPARPSASSRHELPPAARNGSGPSSVSHHGGADMLCHCAADPATPDTAGPRDDNPGVIARPPRIAYLFLGVGLTLGWLWPWPLLPAGWAPAVRYGSGTGLSALGVLL